MNQAPTAKKYDDCEIATELAFEKQRDGGSVSDVNELLHRLNLAPGDSARIIKRLNDDILRAGEDAEKLCYQGLTYSGCVRQVSSNHPFIPVPRIKAIAASEYGWEQLIPLRDQLCSVPDFEYEILPTQLRRWVQDEAERMGVPPEMIAVGAMVAAATLIGPKVQIKPKRFDDWSITPNLWAVTIGAPGSKKTAVISKSLEAVSAFDDEMMTEHRDAQKDYRERMAAFTIYEEVKKKDVVKAFKSGDIDGGNRMSAELEGETPREPPRRQYVVQDATYQKLGMIQQDNPDGLLLCLDEINGWLESLEKNPEARAYYLEGWNGNSMARFQRVGREECNARNCINFIGGAQPNSAIHKRIRQAVRGNFDDGLVQRFQLMIYPDPCPEIGVDRPPDTEAGVIAFAAFSMLRLMQGYTGNPDFEPVEYRFSEDAQQAFDAWYRDNHAQVNDEESAAFASHLSKYASLIPSLALITQLLENTGSPTISVDALEKALKWESFLKAHALRIYSMAKDHGLSAAHKIYSRIESGQLGEKFTERDLKRKQWSGLTDADAIKSGLTVLVEHNALMAEQRESGGRTTTEYRIHPEIRK
jgi:putative DNA primase/helicase